MDKQALDLLTNEELCKMYQNNNSDELFNYFLSRNKNLMLKFTHKYTKRHPEHKDDIESLATVGMWEAIVKFDETKEAKFSTFYHYYVLKALCTFYRQFYMIRVPAYKLNDTEAIEAALCTSLNIGVGDEEDTELIELIPNENSMNGEDYAEAKLQERQLEKALSTLDGRTQMCIKYYLGLIDGNRHTLEDIGQKYGVTRERIRQVITKGLRRLGRTIHYYFDTTGYGPFDPSKKIHLTDSFATQPEKTNSTKKDD